MTSRFYQPLQCCIGIATVAGAARMLPCAAPAHWHRPRRDHLAARRTVAPPAPADSATLGHKLSGRGSCGSQRFQVLMVSVTVPP
eukprot:668476-Rhodomonas_salina.4